MAELAEKREGFRGAVGGNRRNEQLPGVTFERVFQRRLFDGARHKLDNELRKSVAVLETLFSSFGAL